MPCFLKIVLVHLICQGPLQLAKLRWRRYHPCRPKGQTQRHGRRPHLIMHPICLRRMYRCASKVLGGHQKKSRSFLFEFCSVSTGRSRLRQANFIIKCSFDSHVELMFQIHAQVLSLQVTSEVDPFFFHHLEVSESRDPSGTAGRR